METIVITRHAAYIVHLVNLGLIEPGVEVIKHATPEDVAGKHVITSGLPLHLASLTEKLTTVPLFLPFELRGEELTLEQVEKYAQPAASYVIRTEEAERAGLAALGIFW